MSEEVAKEHLALLLNVVSVDCSFVATHGFKSVFDILIRLGFSS
jgi:hypothetical protein